MGDATSKEAKNLALEKIRHILETRAQVVKDLENSEITLNDLFISSESDPMIADIKLLTCLESLPQVGKVKARRIMRSQGIDETQKISELSSDNISKLLEEVQ